MLPRTLGKVLPNRRTPWAGIVFSTALALGLIVVVTFAADTTIISALSGTTALLLLCVFSVVNVACVVLRRDPRAEGGFRAPDLDAVRWSGGRASSWSARGPATARTGSSTRSPPACS